MESLIQRLTPWARQIAARFSAPVYLVGGALKGWPWRDVDIRVELSEEQFKARYKFSGEWTEILWSPENGALQYAVDLWGLSKEATEILRVNLDLQVQPPCVWGRYQDYPKIRVDDLGLS